MNLQLLFQVLVVLVNNAECFDTVIHRLMNYKGESVNMFTYGASSSYCARDYCNHQNAICVDQICCTCHCKDGNFFMSLSHGCLNHRTWIDANVSFGNELVPLVESPNDLRYKKIVVPGIQLNRKCRIDSIFYYASDAGSKHLLIQNPSNLVKMEIFGYYGKILVRTEF